MRGVVLSGILGLWTVTLAVAQEPTFRGEATVNVIEVPVRVFDLETGEPVRGLSRGDFRVLENGIEQEVTNLQELRGLSVVSHGSSDDAMPTPPLELKTQQSVFFFDLFLMLKGDRDRAVAALRRRYEWGLPHGEEVSIVSFDGELRIHLDRGTDRSQVQAALDVIESLPTRGISQRLSFTSALSEAPVSGERNLDFYERQQRSREFFFELERCVERVGDALSAAMARFAAAEGRRVLLTFTPAQPGAGWSPSYSPVDFFNGSARYPAADQWRQVGLEAADLGFTMYLIDSSGLRSSSSSDAEVGITDVIDELMNRDELFGPRGSLTREDPTAREPGDDRPDDRSQSLGQWLERNRRNQMSSCAELTGGAAIFDEDIAQAMRRVDASLGHYYTLGYVASHIGDGREYSIEVSLPGHPSWGVQHRTAYVDLSAAARQAQRLRSAMLFGNDANPLGIRVEVGEANRRFRLGAAGSKRIRLPLDIKIPLGRLELMPRGDLYWGKVLITLFSSDGNGNQSELASHEQPISVEAERLDEARIKGYFSYKIAVEIEGGIQTLYVGVQDSLSGKTSVVPHTLTF
jgi:VWFA-related protein